MGFLIFQDGRGIEADSFPYIHLMSEAKFGDNAFDFPEKIKLQTLLMAFAL